MRRVRAIAQRVDDPDLESFKERSAPLGNAFHIRGVGEAAKAKPERADFTVIEVEGHRLDSAALSFDPAEPASSQPQIRCDRRISTAERGLKYIGECLFHNERGWLVHVDI